MFLFFAAQVAWGACATSRTEQEIQSAFKDAMDAFRANDSTALKAKTSAAIEALECAAGDLTADTLVLAHQVVGLDRRINGTSSDQSLPTRIGYARSAFGSARAVDGRSKLPEDIAPDEGHELYIDYEAYSFTNDVFERLATPKRGELIVDGQPATRVDGQPATRAAINRPTIIQYIADDQVQFTQYRMLKESVEPYPSISPYRGPRLLALGSGAVAIAGGVVWGAYWSAYNTYCSEEVVDTFNCDDAYIESEIQPGLISGYALMGLGGVGLISSGAWALSISPGETMSAQFSRRW